MGIEEIAKRIELARYDTGRVEPGSREKLLDRIAWAAYHNLRAYTGCSRAVLQSLQNHLHLNDGEILKTSTALSAGVARMGETCGALTGCLMALGLVFGSEKLEDTQAYRNVMEVSHELYNRFKEEIGATICFDIQKKLFGGTFDFKKENQAEEWYRAGGLEKCSLVCAIAARTTADIIISKKD